METNNFQHTPDPELNRMAAELYTVLPNMSVAEFSQYAVLKEHMHRQSQPEAPINPMEAVDKELQEATLDLNFASHRYNRAILNRIELHTKLNQETN